MEYWYKNAIIYHFFTFGVCNAPFENSYKEKNNRIREIEKWIPHIKQMNFNTVLLSPVFESKSHGYDTTDYFKIDSRLADNLTFKNLVQKMHDNGIKVVLDGVLNHCGRDFFAFKDLLKNTENSKYVNWFSNVDFTKTNSFNDPFCYDTWSGYAQLPQFNLKNKEVTSYLFEAVQYWIEYFDIDGLRLDAAECLDQQFIKELRSNTTSFKEDFYLMGEVVNSDYTNWVADDKLTSVTNYELFKGFHSSHNDKNLFEIAHSLKRQFDNNEGIYNYFLPYNFVDNHDQSRIASLVETPYYLYTIYILLFTIPGNPSLYYGSEWGIKAIKSLNLDRDIRPYIDIENVNIEEPSLQPFIQKLTSIRKNTPSLCHGDYKEVSIEYQKPFIFKRQLKNQCTYVIINPNDSDFFIDIENDTAKYRDVLNDEEVDIKNLKINKYWGRILVSK
jgi:glycosidase